MSDAPLRPEGGPGSLFIFDSYNFAFRAYHALPMLNAPDGRPVNAVHGFCRMVQAVRREFAPQYVVAIFDAGGDGHRREMYAEYKATRAPTPEDLRPQFPLIREATDALGIPRVEDRGYEADDLIASYTKAARAQGLRVVIVSGDKDLMQLVDDAAPACLLYDTMKSLTVGPQQVLEKFGVPPSRLGDLLALVGDSSDNVPGVPGIGPKTAAALLLEHGDLEGVLAAAPAIPQKARREKLVAHADDARMSRRLVALHEDVALPLPIPQLQDPGADEAAVVEFFEPLGFRQIVRELGSTVRRPAASATAGAPAAATVPVVDEGAIEIGRSGSFEADPDAIVVIGGDDEARLAALVEAWGAQPRLFVHALAEGDDPLRAQLIGLALGGGDGPVAYVPLQHRQADLVSGPTLPLPRVQALLAPLLAADRPQKLAHDHKGLGHLLSSVGLPLGAVAMDPMLVSYALDPARSAHDLEALVHDVLGATLPVADDSPRKGQGRSRRRAGDLDVPEAARVTGVRVQALRALVRDFTALLASVPTSARKLVDDIEMPLSWVLRRVEPRGIVVDTEQLARQSADLATQIAAVQAAVDQQAGHAVHIDSPIQLQKLLFEERSLPPTRKTKTGFTTDAKALEELALLDPIVVDILTYRSLTKLKGTYLDTLPALVDPATSRLRTSFHQAVAATGRLSSADPNLQNIPIRTAEGKRIREAFVAPPGRMLVALDYSQIELRILAHLSGDPNLVSAFVEGVDVHRRTAAEVFGVGEHEVSDEQRRIAKAVNFGVVYGQTAFGLAQQLGIPRGKAGSYIRAYFERVPGVDRYMRELITIASAKGYAETILGRKRRIPELGMRGPSRSYGERIARNTPIQGSAADILKLAMIAVERRLEHEPWAQMLLTVHDELIFECDERRVDELVALAKPLMQDAVTLSVPLSVEAGWGRSWAACKG
ncbi:MAG: DNA polymerase I [Deltaproteobacteria bacterium]|nr:DNA polymerase I [Deltaproteobacteria bacterium]MBK8718001.1 DNA polymerase I [Deltaproteobacteria bacterium]MBP7290166.1 DNA polymerase I [Nannocystaceae bacterium]